MTVASERKEIQKCYAYLLKGTALSFLLICDSNLYHQQNQSYDALKLKVQFIFYHIFIVFAKLQNHMLQKRYHNSKSIRATKMSDPSLERAYPHVSNKGSLISVA